MTDFKIIQRPEPPNHNDQWNRLAEALKVLGPDQAISLSTPDDEQPDAFRKNVSSAMRRRGIRITSTVSGNVVVVWPEADGAQRVLPERPSAPPAPPPSRFEAAPRRREAVDIINPHVIGRAARVTHGEKTGAGL